MGEPVTKRRHIGRILADMGAIAPAQIELILEKQQDSGKRFGETGLEAGLFSEADLAQALAEQFAYPYVDLGDTILDAELVAALPSGLTLKHTLVPLARQDNVLVIAIADPGIILAAADRRQKPDRTPDRTRSRFTASVAGGLRGLQAATDQGNRERG